MHGKDDWREPQWYIRYVQRIASWSDLIPVFDGSPGVLLLSKKSAESEDKF
jgi:hypothetical protein